MPIQLRTGIIGRHGNTGIECTVSHVQPTEPNIPRVILGPLAQRAEWNNAPEEILTQLDEQEFSIGFRWLLAVDSEPQILTDYCFAWMLSIGRHGTGTRLKPLRVDYKRAPFPDLGQATLPKRNQIGVINSNILRA